MDPFVSLTAAAIATTRLKLGTGVCLVAAARPDPARKLVASVDQVSGGALSVRRWRRLECRRNGKSRDRSEKPLQANARADRGDEEMSTKSKAEYHGDMVNFDPVMAWPKPVQKPHPPILVGGAWPQAARRAIRYGDGWCPIGGRPGSSPLDVLDQFRKMARDSGRDPNSLPVTLFNPRRGRRPARPLPRHGRRPRRRDADVRARRQDPADPRPLGPADPPQRVTADRWKCASTCRRPLADANGRRIPRGAARRAQGVGHGRRLGRTT